MRPRSALLILLMLSAVLRFVAPGKPSGLHIDEASNAWNASCLGRTLYDEHRVFLPLLYTRAFNDNRSPMYLYLAAPFEMAFGPLAVRVPAQLSGIAATLLLWQLVRRLAGERAGFIAGLIWALDPTFVQNTRWGHEASITPMLVLAALCLWQRAGLLWTINDAPPKHPLRWVVAAGLFSGFACYGYAAIRLYLPCLLAASILIDGRSTLWKEGRRWLASFVGFALFFGPLVYVHLTDPAINERGRQTWTWEPGDASLTVLGKLAARYVSHFDPRFLFVRGTADDRLATLAPPPPFGALPWAWTPLVVLGIWAVIRRFKTDYLARLAAVALVVYPAGDVLNALGGPNVLRLLGGWWVFALLTTLAIEWIIDALPLIKSPTRASQARVAAASFAVAAALPNVIVLLLRWGTGPTQEWQRGADFEAACGDVEPLLRKYDAVFFTSRDTPYAYAQILSFLNYPPDEFLTEPMIRGTAVDTRRNAPDLLVQAGRLYFLRTMQEMPGIISDAIATGLTGKTLWVIRPAEVWRSPNDRLLKTVRLSDGTPSLLVFEHIRDERDVAGR